MKPTVIYDLGALVDDAIEPAASAQLAKELGKGEHEVERILGGTTPRYLSGEISQGVYWDTVAASLGLEESDPIAVFAQNGSLADQSLLGYIRVQSPQMTLGLISDATPDFVGHYRQKFQLDRLFAAHVIDSELAGQHTYQQLLELAAGRLQANPKTVWFIDRKPVHLKEASALGLRTIDLAAAADYRQALAPITA